MSTLKNEVGIYPNVRPEDYFRLGTVRSDGSVIERGSKDYVMSRSELLKFSKCPEAWKLGLPETKSKAFAFGNLMDALCLTPHLVNDLIVVQPTVYNLTPAKGSYVLTPENYNEAPTIGSYKLTSQYEGDWKPNTKACKEWKAEKEDGGFKVYTPEQYEKLCEVRPWNPRSKHCQKWKAEQEAQGLEVLTLDDLAELKEDKPWNNLATYCREWNSRVPRGTQIISSDMNAEGQKAMQRVKQDAWFSHILSVSNTQTVVVWDWVCPHTGEIVRCKAMLDVVPPANGWKGVLLDLKTTIDASSEAWARHIWKFGYDYQGAFYMDGYNSAAEALDIDDRRERFGHLIIESSAPYQTARRILSDEWITAGRTRYEADLMRYAMCRNSGNYYGYTDNVEDGFETVECPEWVQNKANAEYMMAQDAVMEEVV